MGCENAHSNGLKWKAMPQKCSSAALLKARPLQKLGEWNVAVTNLFGLFRNLLPITTWKS